jgi:hypothetical protein
MAAGATYEPIATTTVTGAAAEITLSSIPATYTDLRLVVYALVNGVASADVLIRFNSDTGTNYSYTEIWGQGTAASSARGTTQSSIKITESAVGTTNGGLVTVDLISYAGSTYKSVLTTGSQDNNGSGYVVRGVGLWRNTSAITSIKIRTSYDNKMGIGSTATLYGIKAA